MIIDMLQSDNTTWDRTESDHNPYPAGTGRD